MSKWSDDFEEQHGTVGKLKKDTDSLWDKAMDRTLTPGDIDDVDTAHAHEDIERERPSKEWIHREQIGKVRGVTRLGFKPVCKKRSFW